MPFWGNKKDQPKPLVILTDLATYPPDCQEFIKPLQRYYDDELASLKALGIPLPTQQQPMRTYYREEDMPVFYNAWESHLSNKFYTYLSLEITFPTFDIPPHLAFDIYLSIDKRSKPAWFFLTGDAELIQEANRLGSLYESWVKVIKTFPVRWFNRDPYEMYKTTHAPFSTIWVAGKQPDFRHFRGPKPSAPLDDVKGFSVEDIELMEKRVTLISQLIGWMHHKVTLPHQLARINAPIKLSDDILFRLPLPNTEMPESRTLKLIPLPEMSSAPFEQFLDSLRRITSPLSFALIAEHGTQYFALTHPANDDAFIKHQLEIHFKDSAAVPHVREFNDDPVYEIALRPNSYCLMKTSSDFHLDPYAQLFAITNAITPNDCLSVAIQFVPLSPEIIPKTMNSLKCGCILADDKVINEHIRDLEKKQPPWFVCVKVISNRSDVVENISTNFLDQYESLKARWERSEISYNISQAPIWGVMSTKELAALAHFPGKDVDCDLLETASMKNKLPPDLYTTNGIEIGSSQARGIIKPVVIPHQVRDRHVYVVGKSGTGKSTLLYNSICQDIEAGSGVAVIDPHGDLVDDVLNYIPERRIKDTIYFNGANKKHPIGLNILNAQSEDEIGLLADDLLVTFKRLSESWGERMENILRHTFHTLLRYDGATFLDIKPLLQQPEFRERVLASIKNKTLADFWQHEYPSYPKDAAQPILNRMSKFSLSPILSGILAQPDAPLNFFDVIQHKKILLIRIPKGEIGEDTAHLLGSLIVSQLQLAVMRRASLPKETRDPYYLYVDEFQNFITSAFEKILSEARKYKLCLTLAHQYISQLDEKTKNATLTNAGTIVMFQSNPADAAALRSELGQYEVTDVTNLSSQDHEAFCRPATQSKDTFKFKTLSPLKAQESYVEEIIEYTRENYAVTQSTPEMINYETRPASPAAPETSLPPLIIPAKALPKNFASTGDKIIYYVTQAEYLSTEQIKQLCYSHTTPAAQASNASRDLKALAENKKVKSQIFGSEKIYSTKPCNPTAHNLAVRDLYTKIAASDYEIAELSFFPTLGAIIPDLAVSFVADDGRFIKTLWEYDAGTEGIGELVKKLNRYTQHQNEYRITFIFDTEERMNLSAKALRQSFLTIAVLDQFTTLNDPAFIRGKQTERAPFFS